jgi:hypothetical protein
MAEKLALNNLPYFLYEWPMKLINTLISVFIGLGLWCFNNISVISWWSVLLVEETRVPGENHQPAASH